jgi:hypothetical protein
MSNVHPTGLGGPEPIGKKTLFQRPPDEAMQTETSLVYHNGENREVVERVRTSIDISKQAYAIIQKAQGYHRLRTGKALPLWKAVSQAIEFYGKEKLRGKERHDNDSPEE